jgi:hypothetical protein
MRAGFRVVAIVFTSTTILCAKQTAQNSEGTKPVVPQVTITTALSQDQTLKGDEVDFTGTIVNGNTEVINDIKITDIIPYEYSILKICRQGRAQPCTNQNKTTVFVDIADQLPAGQRLAFWGSMRAEHPHPKTQINFVIQYSEKSGTSSVVSHAGVNTVQTTWGSFWSRSGKGSGAPHSFGIAGFLAEHLYQPP